jgi:anaphase-promoting complex subunit 4
MYVLADNTASILSIPIQSDTITFSPYNYAAPSQTSGSVTPSDIFPGFTLPPEQTIRAVRMEAHDASDVRGHMPARICLLGSNRTTVRTFALPE